MSPPHDEVGARIRAARKISGLTQQQLADRAHLSKSLITKIERGDRAVTGAVVRAVAHTLKIDPTRLTSDHTDAEQSVDDRIQQVLPDLERALMGFDLPVPDHLCLRPLEELQREAGRAAELRLAAQYRQLSQMLPDLIDQLTVAVQTLDGTRRERACWTLAVAYRCLDAIANKFGYLHLSYLAVERVGWAARQSGDPLMIATADYLRGQACLDVGRYDQGLALLDRSRRTIEPGRAGPREALAVCGALHLRSAVLAALSNAEDTAWSHIDEARTLARHIGADVTHYWTLFGPSNVGIHAVATAVELGNYPRAIDEAAKLRLPPELPKERSSHHYIDLARAYLWTGDRERALKGLLKAERIAPQHTRYHPGTRETVRTLLTLSPRVTDELTGLAARVGLEP